MSALLILPTLNVGGTRRGSESYRSEKFRYVAGLGEAPPVRYVTDGMERVA